MLLVLLVTVPVVVQADTWQDTYDAWAADLVCREYGHFLPLSDHYAGGTF